MSETIRIGGREFDEITQSTLEHDAYFMTQMRLAGLDSVVLRPGEAPEGFATRLLFDVMSSGRLFDILGGLVLPAGVASTEWTPALAHDTGQFLARLTEPADKERAQKLILSLLIPFFIDALDFSQSSKGSSTEGECAGEGAAPGPTSGATASGTASSAPSPATIPIGEAG